MGLLALAGLWLAQEAAPDLDAARARITAETLRRHVEFLASDELEGREAGTPGNDRAAEYLIERLQEAGLEPAAQGFRHRFRQGREEMANIAAVWEGSDPERRRQYVVLGAHFDHIGVVEGSAAADTIHNGADDNASGTAVLLEVARALAETDLRPARSVLFLAFNAEEKGLIGSRQYVRRPIAGIERHVAMINLDMVGRNPQAPVQIHGVGTAAGGVLRGWTAEAAEREQLPVRLYSVGDLAEMCSDDYPFWHAEVPTLSFFTDYHGDYHEVGDHADKLDYGRMAKIAGVVIDLVWAIGNAEERPEFLRPLGIGEGEEIAHGEGGAVRITSLVAGSVAVAARMRTGDLLVEFDGSLPAERPMAELEARVERLAPGARVQAKVLRGDEEIEVECRW